MDGRPAVVAGEQVAQSGGWIDRTRDDLEMADYRVAAADLPACSVGQDHLRYRLYFVGDTDRQGEPVRAVDAEVARVPGAPRDPRTVAAADGVPARMGRLRAYGNAIVPEVAARFLQAYLAARSRR